MAVLVIATVAGLKEEAKGFRAETVNASVLTLSAEIDVEGGTLVAITGVIRHLVGRVMPPIERPVAVVVIVVVLRVGQWLIIDVVMIVCGQMVVFGVMDE